MKHLFNFALIELTAEHISQHYQDFDKAGFIALASDDLDNRELKDRANQINLGFKRYLPSDYEQAVHILLNTLHPVQNNQVLEQIQPSKLGLCGWIIMPMTQFVGEQGQSHLSLSMSVLKQMTQRFSSEFGIRYFLLEQPEASLAIMETWLTDPCHHVRRLVSEGTRPLLPWAMQLPNFKHRPQPIIALLSQLKDDDSQYVRRSVANNLNDIAKHHPDLVADLAKQWLQSASNDRTRLIKHACRTLIKQGHPQALANFGYAPAEALDIQLTLSEEQVQLGEHQTLICTITNPHSISYNLLVDYLVYHKKANGKLAPKVFKWKALELAPNASIQLQKHHAFVPITTRKYYSGEHQIALQVNGKIYSNQSFTLNV